MRLISQPYAGGYQSDSSRMVGLTDALKSWKMSVAESPTFSDCVHHSPFLGLLQFLGAIRSFYPGQAHMDKCE
jgi:hypothetical protein